MSAGTVQPRERARYNIRVRLGKIAITSPGIQKLTLPVHFIRRLRSVFVKHAFRTKARVYCKYIFSDSLVVGGGWFVFGKRTIFRYRTTRFYRDNGIQLRFIRVISPLQWSRPLYQKYYTGYKRRRTPGSSDVYQSKSYISRKIRRVFPDPHVSNVSIYRTGPGLYQPKNNIWW